MSVQLGDFTGAFRHGAAGSGATRAKALNTFKSLQEHASKSCWGKTTPANITPKQVAGYLKSRVAKGISARSVQNEASHIRRSVRGAGRKIGDLTDAKNNWSSTRLGVPKGSRIGGKAAINIEKFTAARERMSTPMQTVLDLQMALGLRREEAVIAKNTSDWKVALTAAQAQNRGTYLQLTADAGTKGGRPRHIFVPPERVSSTLGAVSVACNAKVFDGHILDYPDLKHALKGYDNAMSYQELTNTDSGHGIRRFFSCEQYDYYLSSGLDKNTALSRLSQDLGHGDGRGRWVWNNYLSGSRSE